MGNSEKTGNKDGNAKRKWEINDYKFIGNGKKTENQI